MRIAGNGNEKYAEVLFVIFAIIAGLLLVVQIAFIQKMKIFSTFAVVVISVCICYENAVLATGDDLTHDSGAIQLLYVLQALQIPLFTICLYETAYRLYEEKGANLATVQLEERLARKCSFPCCGLWFITLVAIMLFILNILTNYQLLDGVDYLHAGSGGYVYLSKHPESVTVWLALIPPIVLSIVALVTSFLVARYGSEYTIGLSHLHKWKVLIVAALCQAVGQVFDARVYPVTSNAGELALLIGVTYFLHLAQDDLILTAHFADFLHQSNAAFSHAALRQSETTAHIEEVASFETKQNTMANSQLTAGQVEMVNLQGSSSESPEENKV